MTRWTLEDARSAHAKGQLQTWIENYLQVPEWSNPGLLRRVREYSVVWPAPELVQIDQFILIAGPSESFMFPKDPDVWEQRIAPMVVLGINPELLPPLIGWVREDGRLNLADGNHRVEAAKRLGIEHLWALIHPTPLK